MATAVNPVDLTLAEKNAYMKALLSIAAVDDNIGPPELERIKAAARRFGCRLKASDLKTFSLDGIARGIQRPHVQKACLAEIVDIAKADRKLSSDELQLIKFLCAQWGLPLPDLGVGWEQVKSPGDAREVKELEDRTRDKIVTGKFKAIGATSQGFSITWIVGSVIIMAIFVALTLLAVDQGRRKEYIKGAEQLRNAYLIGFGLSFFLGGFIVGRKSAGRTLLEPALAAGAGVFGGLYALARFTPMVDQLRTSSGGYDWAVMGIWAAVPFIVAMIGAWVGEALQRAKTGY